MAEEAKNQMTVEENPQPYHSTWCDLTVLHPGVIKDAEYQMTAPAMSKILLERSLVRKELKLRILHQRLVEQAQKLKEAQQKLTVFQASCVCQNTEEVDVPRITETSFWMDRFSSTRVIQSLASVYQLLAHTIARSAQNILMECKGAGSWSA